MKMNLASVLSCLLLLFSGLLAWGFPSAAARTAILELLNGKAQKGQLVGSYPVSFDEINCSRGFKNCTLSLRFMIPQEDFFVIRKSLCNVAPVDTVYDILDEKTGDLTDYFLNSVKSCL